MKVLLDTNVVIDFLSKRDLFYDNAKFIFDKCYSKEINGIVAVHTVSTIYYVLKKYNEDSFLRTLLLNLFQVIEIGSAQKSSVINALKNNSFSDFEDSLQHQCALEQIVDCIITRNPQDFINSKIKVYTPAEFVSLYSV